MHLYAFMLLRGSIESDNHNGAIEKCEKRSDKPEIFEYLPGIMVLNSNIEPVNNQDFCTSMASCTCGVIVPVNHNGALENVRIFRIKLQRYFLTLVWLLKNLSSGPINSMESVNHIEATVKCLNRSVK